MQQTKDLISKWSGCMTLDNFKTAKMINWARIPTTDGNACSSCHSQGLEGFYASQDETKFFTSISTIKDFMLPYFIPDLPNNTMAINTNIFVPVGNRQMPFEDHPKFDPANNVGITALQAYFTSTKALFDAGTCGAPTIPAN